MSSKFYVGGDVISSTDNGKYKPISRVTLYLDDHKCLTAGDDTGHEIVADCPHATQEMVNALLANLKGHEYQAFEADEANIDPAAELGDGITVGGVYGGISRMMDDGMGYPSLSAPGEAELEDEYPMEGPLTRMFNRQLSKAYSLIAKTAEEIRMEVNGKVGNDEVNSLIKTALDGITMSVSSANGSTTFKLMANGAELDTETLNLTVNAVNITGQLTASQINATGLKVDAANITGTLAVGNLPANVATLSDIPSDYDITIITNNAIRTASISANQITAGTFIGSSLSLSGLLTLYYGSMPYGYIGATTVGSADGIPTQGAVLTDPYARNGFIATNAGARMTWNATNEIYCVQSGCYSTSELKVASDARLKNSISYDLSREEVMFATLKPCSFVYNRDKKNKKHWGFVAQEVVDGAEAAGLQVDTLDFVGKDEKDMYAIAYGEITALNTYMIQKLMARVSKLEENVNG